MPSCHRSGTWYRTCADPEIFMRGGPTKIVIFGYRRGGGGSNPQKIPKLPFLGKIFKFQGGGGGTDPRSPPLDPRISKWSGVKVRQLIYRVMYVYLQRWQKEKSSTVLHMVILQYDILYIFPV